MTDYATYWAPQSRAEAEFQIDVGHSGAAFLRWGEERARELIAYTPDVVCSVVDYGCGIGRVIRHMPGSRRVGIDVSAEMLAYAREDVPDCEFIQGDGRTIPLDDDSVDFVYSLLALQHMDAADAANVVKETHRVLRTGGTCLLQFSGFGMDWAPGAMLERGPCHWTGTRDGSWHSAHLAFRYSPEIVRRLADDAGLTVLGIIKQGDAAHPYWALWGRK